MMTNHYTVFGVGILHDVCLFNLFLNFFKEYYFLNVDMQKPHILVYESFCTLLHLVNALGSKYLEPF